MRVIEPARLTILTKSSTLITDHLSKYEYFCQNQPILCFFRPALLISFAITSIFKVKSIISYILGIFSQQLKNNIPACLLNSACMLNRYSKNMSPCSLDVDRSSYMNLRVFCYDLKKDCKAFDLICYYLMVR